MKETLAAVVRETYAMREAQLLLWGDSGVGKTTLLVAGLLANPDRLPKIQWAAQPPLGRTMVINFFRGMKENRIVGQTEKFDDIHLPLENGNKLIIRDVSGLRTRLQWQEEDSFQQKDKPQGVLFVCEWQGGATEAHMAVVEATLPLCTDFKVGLVITKSDKGLQVDDPHWQAPVGWWEEHDCWQPYARVLQQFEDRVWPTSAFGFDPDGRPGVVLGEFGELIPYRIQPRNVDAPFRWFFKESGLGSSDA